MKRIKIVRIHIFATIIAMLTISSFFSFSLIAELMGDHLFIQRVKTVILYALPILIISMPMLAVSGKKLAGNSKNPLITKKMKRMKFIAFNGFILISLAIYLYYHTNYKVIDNTFLYFQIAELLFGAINLSLMGMNVKDGLKLSGRNKR